ncbi:MAG: M6 family metalloprotease domain-containing protein [Candidatus Hydrogenedentes bacterium]|nr:M6 family metalloprotease domain-containing protein [Candidatus Hydrogenedentota bacterium]
MAAPARRFLLGVCLLALALGAASPASAAPYIGLDTFTYHQPDGTPFSVKLYGDEYFAYQETLDGFVVVKDSGSGYYCYARLSQDGRSFVSTGIPVASKARGRADSALLATRAGVTPKLRLPGDAVLAAVRKAQQKFRVDGKGRPLPVESDAQPSLKSSPLRAPPSATTTGSFVGLCILVDFSDEPGAIPQGDVASYFNQAAGYTAYSNACSVREYFDIQSAGLLDYTNVVTSYVRVSQPKTYYDDDSERNWGSSKAQELVAEALDILIGQGFDFTQLSTYPSGGRDYIRCINVFYAGTCASGWGLGLWPHSWAIPSKQVDAAHNIYAYRYQMTDMKTSLAIGTTCHENGHMLCGFPDLYSYNGNPASIGYFSLMSHGNHADGGRHPVNVDPYLKAAAGWATVIDVLPGDHLTATVNVSNNTYYRFPNPSDPEEYFIFEARGPGGYEGPYGGSSASVNPTSGVVGYHALESGSNTHSTITDSTSCDYTTPYELLLLEAGPADNSPNPWYLDPTPGSTDGFYSSGDGGVDTLSADTLPELTFWASDGRTIPSPFTIHSISSIGSTMTFDVGFASDEIAVFIVPEAAVLAGAQWRLDAGAWRDSGDVITGLSPGTYTVSFSDVTGYNTPADELITLSGGHGETVLGEYTVETIPLPVALNAPELTWITSGDADWYGQRLTSCDGHAAGQSGDISDSQSSTVQATVTGPGTARFRWKVRSEAGWDYLRFLVDGSPASSISGDVAWTLVEYPIGAGPHTVAWVYEKDTSLSAYEDCGWLDEVCFVPSGSASGSLLVTLLPASAVSAGAQWRVDGGAWQESQATVNLLAAGTHTVSFSTVAGWDSPADAQVSVVDNAVTTESATYTPSPATGSLTVTIQPAGALAAGAMWNVDGGAWRNSGDTASGLSVGNHLVVFLALPEWDEPGPVTLAVSDGATTPYTGTYTYAATALPAPGGALLIACLGVAGWLVLRHGGGHARKRGPSPE